MSGSLKRNMLSGIAWQYFQRIGNQMIHFMVSLILARLLMPEDFGTVALLGVFISISNIFIDSGFGNALIQRKEIDDIDTSSVFYLNVVLSFIFYCFVFLCAPFVSNFYEMPQMTSLLRVLAIQVVVMALGCVQHSILVRKMRFKFNFYIGMFSVIISSATGLGMAYSGKGVWSIVFSQLMAQLCTCIGLWYFVAWRPKLTFSWERIKSLFSYGSRILGGSIIDVIYNNIYNLIIGKRYSSADLGFYNRGQLLPTTVIDTASTSFYSVLFPALSSIQDDKERHLSIIRQTARLFSFVVFFVGGMMVVLAPNIIRLLLGEKWMLSVPFMQIVSITVSIAAISVMNQSIQTSIGRSDLYLKTTGISKIISVALVLLASFVNLLVMVIAGTVSAIITLFITSRYNKSLVGYSFSMHLSDILPAVLLSIFTSGIVFLFTLSRMNDFFVIVIGGAVGILVYVGTAFLLKFDAIEYIKNLLLSNKIRRTK